MLHFPMVLLRLICPLLLVAGAMSPGTAAAHPHVFIETGQQLLFDSQGRLAAVRVVWVYDEFYSLLILEDRGLDPEADGVLTKAERQSLTGFDMNWDPGFAGDLYAKMGDTALTLSRPEQVHADFREGHLISTHLRTFAEPVEMGAEPLILQAYDPTYYTAYSISIDPIIEGRAGCTAQVFVPDPDAASAELRAALAELNATQTLDDLGIENFPPIGETFAEEVRLTCLPPA